MADAPEQPIVILSCSLNSTSRSHRLALAAERVLTERGYPVRLVDLREWDLPFCDGESGYDSEPVRRLSDMIRGAAGLILAAPVYNYDLNAASKNLLEMTGSAWKEKPVGFLCSAGGRSSYMAPMSFANSLMFDYRCLIVPRFVYAIGDDFRGEALSDDIERRVAELAQGISQLAGALQAES